MKQCAEDKGGYPAHGPIVKSGIRQVLSMPGAFDKWVTTEHLDRIIMPNIFLTHHSHAIFNVMLVFASTIPETLSSQDHTFSV